MSGTYGSVNDRVCRIIFDEAWVKPLGGSEEGGTTTGRAKDNDASSHCRSPSSSHDSARDPVMYPPPASGR